MITLESLFSLLYKTGLRNLVGRGSHLLEKDM